MLLAPDDEDAAVVSVAATRDGIVASGNLTNRQRGPWVSSANQPDNYPPRPIGPPPRADIGRLLLRCHDRAGIIAAVSAFLSQAGANIVSLDQHSTAPDDE